MNCPTCGLINPDTALRCDCGYDFASREVKDSYLSKTELESRRPSFPKSRRKLFWQQLTAWISVALGRSIAHALNWKMGSDSLDALAWITLLLGIIFAAKIRREIQRLLKARWH